MKATRTNPAMRKLAQRLKVRFPEATVDLDPPGEAGGIWFLDVTLGKHAVAVQWQPGTKGFGITSTAEPGYGEGAHEVVHGTDTAFDRIGQLLLARGRMPAPEPIARRRRSALPRGRTGARACRALRHGLDRRPCRRTPQRKRLP